MSNLVGGLGTVCAITIIAAGAQSVHAMGGGGPPLYTMGGGGPPAWTMTLAYCREMVTNKGITDVAQFEAEVKKCRANPVTYPPAYTSRAGSVAGPVGPADPRVDPSRLRLARSSPRSSAGA